MSTDNAGHKFAGRYREGGESRRVAAGADEMVAGVGASDGKVAARALAVDH